MNQRIQQLALEAEVFAKQNNSDFYYFYTRKFAELIVAECTEQVRGQYVPVLEDKEMMKDTHWDGYVQCGVDSVVAIREHFFGVEE
jgi:hypothetical protein